MAINQTALCNAAISYCGTRSKITSIIEGSFEANSCLSHYDMALDATLRAADWNFARFTKALSLVTGTGGAATRWTYEYGLPDDLVRVRYVNDVPFLLLPETFMEMAADKDSGGNPIRVLYCNSNPVSLIYTGRVVDPNRWDAAFVDAFALELASRICFEITGKQDRVEMLAKQAMMKLAEARAQNGNETTQPNRSYVPEALAARGYDDGLAEIGQVYPTSSWPWPTSV